MKKTSIDIREKIATRAYYTWLNGSAAGVEADWLAAEAIELAYAERRAVAVRKAAETRKAKIIPSVTIAAVATKRRPASHRAVQH